MHILSNIYIFLDVAIAVAMFHVFEMLSDTFKFNTFGWCFQHNFKYMKAERENTRKDCLWYIMFLFISECRNLLLKYS